MLAIFASCSPLRVVACLITSAIDVYVVVIDGNKYVVVIVVCGVTDVDADDADATTTTDDAAADDTTDTTTCATTIPNVVRMPQLLLHTPHLPLGYRMYLTLIQI